MGDSRPYGLFSKIPPHTRKRIRDAGDALGENFLKSSPLRPLSKAFARSAEVRVRKPAAAFYGAALERFGLAAADCLFFDDPAENVAGAAACGIKGMVFTGDVQAVARFIAENE